MSAARLMATTLVLCLSLSSQASAGKRPPPPPTHPHAAEIARLGNEIAKVRAAQQAALTRVQARYAADVTALNLPGLRAAVVRLQREREAAVQKLADKEQLALLVGKYQPKIETLQKQIKARNSQLTQLNSQLQATTSKILAQHKAQLAKLESADEGLDGKLMRVLGQRNADLLKLIDTPAAVQAQAKLQAKIDGLYQRVRARQAAQTLGGKQKKSLIAAVKAFYAAAIAQVTSAAGRPDIQLARLLETKRLELLYLVDAQAIADLEVLYLPRIDALKVQVKARTARLAELNQEQLDRIAAIETAYIDGLAMLDSPLDVLATEIAAVRAQQLADLLLLAESAAAQAIIAKYQPGIDALTTKIQSRNAQISQLLERRQAEVARATAAVGAAIAKLNIAEDPLEFQLVRVQEQQWAAIVTLAGRANVKDLLAKYDALIVGATTQSVSGQKQLMISTQRAVADMNVIVRNHEAHVTNLQRRIHELLMQPGRK